MSSSLRMAEPSKDEHIYVDDGISGAEFKKPPVTRPLVWTPAEIRAMCGEQVNLLEQLLLGDVVGARLSGCA